MGSCVAPRQSREHTCTKPPARKLRGASRLHTRHKSAHLDEHHAEKYYIYLSKTDSLSIIENATAKKKKKTSLKKKKRSETPNRRGWGMQIWKLEVQFAKWGPCCTFLFVFKVKVIPSTLTIICVFISPGDWQLILLTRSLSDCTLAHQVCLSWHHVSWALQCTFTCSVTHTAHIMTQRIEANDPET